MAVRRFIDTNVLLYSVSRHPGEATKRERAVALLAADDLALAQTLQEFHVQATRFSRTDALPHDIAAGLVHAWARFPVQEISLLGRRELLSEDMGHGRRIDDLRIVNPFR